MDAAAVRDFVIAGLRLAGVFAALLTAVPVLVMAERRICAAIQDRVGPDRVGPFGVLQPLADAIKNLFKEDLVPEHVDRFLYTVSPLLSLAPPLLMFAVVPFGNAITLTPGGVGGAGAVLMAAGPLAGLGLVALAFLARSRGPRTAWLAPVLVVAGLGAVVAGLAAGAGLRALAGTIPAEGMPVRLQVADLPVGLLFCVAMISMGVYAVALGGWASNDKYSLLGSLRASAQMISYEVVMGISVILVLMATSDGVGVGTVRMSDIVARQAETMTVLGIPVPGWNVLRQPLAFLFFVLAGFAENKRLPFDLPECEAELVGGYHTEYSSMKFALFMMGEYLAMVAISAVTVALFLGGWHVPGLDPSSATLASGVLTAAAFAAKTGALLFLYIWVRWSMPRFRYDHLMALGWKVMVPLAFLNFVVSAVMGAV
jgi:NADH-quinone oxidoreductase subunit H